MVVVDVETTGINPKRHSIVSIGAVDFFHSENQFYEECRIWKGAEITQEALERNGFSLEEVKDPNKKSLEEAIKSFLEWIEKIEQRTIAGHNLFFDLGFLRDSLKRYNIKFSFGHRIIDLHSLCYTHFLKRGLTPPLEDKRTDLNLDKILKYVGLPEEPMPHNGLTGAKMEAEAFSRIIYGKPLLDEFKKHKTPDYLL